VDIAVYNLMFFQLKPLFLGSEKYLSPRDLLSQPNQAPLKTLCIKVLFSIFPTSFISYLLAFFSLPKSEVKTSG